MVDLCHGPHLPNTGYLKSSAVGAVNRAFWRADVKREPLQVRSQLCGPSWSDPCPLAHLTAAQGCWETACWPVPLPSQQPAAPRHQRDVWRQGRALCLVQRVYGVTFPDKKLMEEYKKRMEEAKKRDHRRLGTDQKLFFFNPVSPGSAFFLPRGMTICRRLIQVLCVHPSASTCHAYMAQAGGIPAARLCFDAQHNLLQSLQGIAEGKTASVCGNTSIHGSVSALFSC